MTWHDDAACRGRPELFYAPTTFYRDGRGHGLTAVDRETPEQREDRRARARALCASCSVIEQCGADARSRREEYGIWAGETPQQRGIRRRGLDRIRSVVPVHLAPPWERQRSA